MIVEGVGELEGGDAEEEEEVFDWVVVEFPPDVMIVPLGSVNCMKLLSHGWQTTQYS